MKDAIIKNCVAKTRIWRKCVLKMDLKQGETTFIIVCSRTSDVVKDATNERIKKNKRG